VLADVVPALDPVSGQVVATWADRLSQVVTYSFYNGVTWTPPATIDMGSSIGCFNDPYVAAEPTGALVVTWSNTDSARVPYFSIYQNGVWSTGAPIPLSPSASTGTLQDTAIARVAGTSIMVATWGGDSDELPYYSTFVGLPTTGLLPPTDGQGSHVKNRFALLIEWYNQLDWTASTSPDVVGYNIRRNGALIASHVFGTSYRDGNRPHKGTDVYSITSVNAEGLESVATLEITVTN
jgi:hypothetical protein